MALKNLKFNQPNKVGVAINNRRPITFSLPFDYNKMGENPLAVGAIKECRVLYEYPDMLNNEGLISALPDVMIELAKMFKSNRKYDSTKVLNWYVDTAGITAMLKEFEREFAYGLHYNDLYPDAEHTKYKAYYISSLPYESGRTIKEKVLNFDDINIVKLNDRLMFADEDEIVNNYARLRNIITTIHVPTSVYEAIDSLIGTIYKDDKSAHGQLYINTLNVIKMSGMISENNVDINSVDTKKLEDIITNYKVYYSDVIADCSQAFKCFKYSWTKDYSDLKVKIEYDKAYFDMIQNSYTSRGLQSTLAGLEDNWDTYLVNELYATDIPVDNISEENIIPLLGLTTITNNAASWFKPLGMVIPVYTGPKKYGETDLSDTDVSFALGASAIRFDDETRRLIQTNSPSYKRDTVYGIYFTSLSLDEFVSIGTNLSIYDAGNNMINRNIAPTLADIYGKCYFGATEKDNGFNQFRLKYKQLAEEIASDSQAQALSAIPYAFVDIAKFDVPIDTPGVPFHNYAVVAIVPVTVDALDPNGNYPYNLFISNDYVEYPALIGLGFRRVSDFIDESNIHFGYMRIADGVAKGYAWELNGNSEYRMQDQGFTGYNIWGFSECPISGEIKISQSAKNATQAAFGGRVNISGQFTLADKEAVFDDEVSAWLLKDRDYDDAAVAIEPVDQNLNMRFVAPDYGESIQMSTVYNNITKTLMMWITKELDYCIPIICQSVQGAVNNDDDHVRISDPALIKPTGINSFISLKEVQTTLHQMLTNIFRMDLVKDSKGKGKDNKKKDK